MSLFTLPSQGGGRWPGKNGLQTKRSVIPAYKSREEFPP